MEYMFAFGNSYFTLHLEFVYADATYFYIGFVWVLAVQHFLSFVAKELFNFALLSCFGDGFGHSSNEFLMGSFTGLLEVKLTAKALLNCFLLAKVSLLKESLVSFTFYLVVLLLKLDLLFKELLSTHLLSECTS